VLPKDLVDFQELELAVVLAKEELGLQEVKEELEEEIFLD
jgi:hypothetical protein